MLVRISKDWDYLDIFRQTRNSSGVWEGVNFTIEEVDECDLLVVLNRPRNNIKVRCVEKWLFSHESPVDIYRWHLSSFKYFDKVFSFWDGKQFANIIRLQTALPWHINRSYDELIRINILKCRNKLDKVSWVTSNANCKPGHIVRLKFRDYMKKNRFNFDLFGRGFNPIEDKFDGLFPYKYSLALENYSCNDYWTEKIADCYLSWTIPIYWGAINITEYFPKNSMILIDPSKPEQALGIIKDAIRNKWWDNNLKALAEARYLVLNKYQFFPHIVNLIDQYELAGKKRKYYFIRKNLTTKERIHRIKIFIKQILSEMNIILGGLCKIL